MEERDELRAELETYKSEKEGWAEENASLRADLEAVQQDKERLDWLESNAFGSGVIGDDAGRWAVPSCGFQPLVVDMAIGGEWTYDLEVGDWKDSIRIAIDAAREAWEDR